MPPCTVSVERPFLLLRVHVPPNVSKVIRRSTVVERAPPCEKVFEPAISKSIRNNRYHDGHSGSPVLLAIPLRSDANLHRFGGAELSEGNSEGARLRIHAIFGARRAYHRRGVRPAETD